MNLHGRWKSKRPRIPNRNIMKKQTACDINISPMNLWRFSEKIVEPVVAIEVWANAMSSDCAPAPARAISTVRISFDFLILPATGPRRRHAVYQRMAELANLHFHRLALTLLRSVRAQRSVSRCSSRGCGSRSQLRNCAKGERSAQPKKPANPITIPPRANSQAA